jgi:hypothetical protein
MTWLRKVLNVVTGSGSSVARSVENCTALAEIIHLSHLLFFIVMPGEYIGLRNIILESVYSNNIMPFLLEMLHFLRVSRCPATLCEFFKEKAT